MAHLQYMPGDPRLVDQLVYELKSKGIFDQFRKDCIADVDTRPAYQNLRQRVESSVSTFLSRQCWQPDLNKNQLREKLRKHILDGNYLEQGVERIVDQVVNPKVASVFIPQVEDLVYNYLGITRKKTVINAESSNEKIENLLPTDLEAVSPGSVNSNDGDDDQKEMDVSVADESNMEIDEQESPKIEPKEEKSPETVAQDKEITELFSELPGTSEKNLNAIDKTDIPLPVEDCISFKVENIPPPEDSPPRIDLGKIELPKSPEIQLPDSIIISADIPLPDEIPKDVKDEYFKTINSDEDESSTDSSLRRNMSPLTPIRNFNNENSCDAQQAFENDLGNTKNSEKKEPSTFRFAIETKSPEDSKEAMKTEKKEIEQLNLSYQFNHQVNINNFNTPLYEESSNSNNLQIDYESDANSKANVEAKLNEEQSMDDSKKDRKVEEKKSSHKSSHRSRDSSKYSSSRDKRSDSKPSSSRDGSRHDKKSSKDEHSKSKPSHKDRLSDKNDKKDSDKKERDSSRHRSSHRSSSHRDSKSHKSSTQRHSSKHSDEKKSSSSSSNHKEKSEKSSERNSEKSSKDRSSKDSKSSSRRSDKDRKSSSSKSSSKHDEKDKDKKSKKETDDHYGLSGRGNSNRRSTDRDSNDGSSSSKGSHNPSSTKSSTSQKDSKANSSKSDNTSPSGESTSPCDKDHVVKETKKSNTDVSQPKPIVRIDTRLELPMASPPRLPFVPEVTLRKPKIAANLEEAKKLMKMRRFLDEEQKRMNQEAALLLEFQANVRPSLSQVYSSIPGPELEFACVTNNEETQLLQNNPAVGDPVQRDENILISNPTNALLAVVNAQKIEDITGIESELSNLTESNDSKGDDSMNESELPLESESIEKETMQKAGKIEVQTQDDTVEIHDVAEARIPDVGNEIDETKQLVVLVDDTVTKPESKNNTENSYSVQEIDSEVDQIKSIDSKDNDKRTEYFEITVIAEELSESEETQDNIMEKFENECLVNNKCPNAKEVDEHPVDNNNTAIKDIENIEGINCVPDKQDFKYFTDSEKHEADLEKDRFSRFLKMYTERQLNNKIYLINCDSYEESIIKGVLETLGTFEIVNYQRNGRLKLPKTTKSIVKNVNVASEVSLPFDNNEFEAAANELEMDLKVTRQTVLSPVKSECSFELSSDYDAKIDEMVSNASRQEIMEIILGNAMSSESPSKMPKIDYVNESNIDSEVTCLKRKLTEAETDYVNECNIDSEVTCLKRKLTEAETTVNNNRPVLTPRKLRKMSTSDQITSTTQEGETQPSTRSKYLGRARRVGLSRPRKSDQPNSPSSDKSIENYEQNSKDVPVLPPNPNGKMKTPQRNKIQRYDTSDLYKPKLHYLSRRNNIN